MTPALALLAACGHEPRDGAPGTDTNELPDPTGTFVERPDVDPRDPANPRSCDAGTDAWVGRVFPLVLGRRPHGAQEVRAWSELADQHGRDVAVRALTADPQYIDHWKPLLGDLLHVSRETPLRDMDSADRDAICFDNVNRVVHDGTLARHIRDNDPRTEADGPKWTMGDLMLDALVLDDLSPLWRANLFARTNYVPFCLNNVDVEQVEHEQRARLADELMDVYLGRDLACLQCHNSEFSVTDDPDPQLDRTWGVDALFEQAMFGQSFGPTDPSTFEAAFRYYQIVEGTDPAYRRFVSGPFDFPDAPWGWSQDCGQFRWEAPATDVLGVEDGYFLRPFGPEATPIQLDAALRSGVRSIAESGELDIALDRTLPADQAFAWLTAQHLVDQIWSQAFGSRLTLPYGFSRNLSQQQRLEQLTRRFATHHWSVRDLLAAIAVDPLFNVGLPETCPSQEYALPPVVDPYSVEESDARLRGNGPGELVRRQFARTLLESAHDALGFDPPTEFQTRADSPTADLQAALGVFLTVTQAGHNGVDLQGVLAWETAFATCERPGIETDMVDRVIALAAADGATTEDAALTIKDRLVGRATWDDDGERAEVQALLGSSLDDVVAAGPVDARLERGLRLFCGVLTLSPEFHMSVEPHDPGPKPPLDLDSDVDCAARAYAWGTVGVSVRCIDK